MRKLSGEGKGAKKVCSKVKGGGLRSTRLRKHSKSEHSQWVVKCDDMWSEIIKLIHGKVCILCGSINKIASHHVFAKGQCGAVRYNIHNGVPLCWACHKWKAHTNPEMYRDEIIGVINNKFGVHTYEELKSKAREICHRSVEDLKDKYKVLKKTRDYVKLRDTKNLKGGLDESKS